MSNNDITVTMSMEQYEALKKASEQLRSTENAYEKSRKEVATLSERCNILLERIKRINGLTAEEESDEESYKLIVFNDVEYQINLDDNRVLLVGAEHIGEVGEWDPKRGIIKFDP
jgi:hypothetical protein